MLKPDMQDRCCIMMLQRLQCVCISAASLSTRQACIITTHTGYQDGIARSADLTCSSCTAVMLLTYVTMLLSCAWSAESFRDDCVAPYCIDILWQYPVSTLLLYELAGDHHFGL
eukprot:GHUV01044765.1.p1 GENE.GHUV01044765.1~~GHUV01044765.1.p1  ORF type:complete len:114 (-),score=21.79 GHUV01044765.1:611-952(-)